MAAKKASSSTIVTGQTEDGLTEFQVQQLNQNIEEKGRAAIGAANAQFTVDTDRIRDKMIYEVGGFDYTLQQMEEKKEEAQDRVKRLKLTKDPVMDGFLLEKGRLDNSIESEIDRARLEVKTKVEELEAGLRLAIAALKESKTTRVQELDTRINTRRRELIALQEPGLLQEIDSINEVLPKLKAFCDKIAPDVEREARQAEAARDKLGMLIASAQAEAKQAVLECKSIKEAREKIAAIIPTVSQVIAAPQSKENMSGLMSKLSPDYDLLALPAPTHPHEDAKENNAADAAAVDGLIVGQQSAWVPGDANAPEAEINAEELIGEIEVSQN